MLPPFYPTPGGVDLRAHLSLALRRRQPQDRDTEARKAWAQGFASKSTGVRAPHPGYPLWRDFPYEYVHDRLAIDVINGGPALREWVDDDRAMT